MRRHITPEAWARNLFCASLVAQDGGPVRVEAASVVRYSTPAVVLAEAIRRGRVISSVGDYWMLHSNTLRVRSLS